MFQLIGIPGGWFQAKSQTNARQAGAVQLRMCDKKPPGNTKSAGEAYQDAGRLLLSLGLFSPSFQHASSPSSGS